MSIKNSRAVKVESGCLDRRSFLKLGAISSALPGVAAVEVKGGSSKPAPGAEHARTANDELLPAVPTLADLASDRLIHHFRDQFNPPAAQNEWGYLQATKSISGITKEPQWADVRRAWRPN